MKKFLYFLKILSILFCIYIYKKTLAHKENQENFGIVVKEPADLRNGPDFLTPGEQKADLQVVFKSLENTYVGWTFLNLQQQEEFKNKLFSSVKATNTSAKSFCQNLALHLNIFPDNHLLVQKYGQFSCPAHVLKSFRNKENIQKKTPQDKTSWSLDKKSGVTILRIYDFAPYFSNRWDGFLTSLQTALAEKPKNFILDLRDNGGGDSAMGDKIVGALIGSSQSFLNDPPWQEIINPASEMFFNNALKIKEFRYGSFDKPALETVNDIPLPASFVHPEKVWVLINGGCGSSCEITVLKLKNHPNVTLVGQNTAGAYEYGNAGAVVLPNSKLILRLPRQHKNLLPTARFELIGIPPDKIVPENLDIEDFTFKIIK